MKGRLQGEGGRGYFQGGGGGHTKQEEGSVFDTPNPRSQPPRPAEFGGAKGVCALCGLPFTRALLKHACVDIYRFSVVFLTFYNCIVPMEFLPWEIRVAFPRVYVQVCAQVCMHGNKHACMHMYTHMHMHVHAHTHARTHAHTHTHTHTLTSVGQLAKICF